MTLIPAQFIDSVVSLGVIENRSYVAKATGTIYGHYLHQVSETQAAYDLYFVTNRHVIENASIDHFRVNAQGTDSADWRKMKEPDDGSPLWFSIPNSPIDIAISAFRNAISTNAAYDFSFFKSNVDIKSSSEMNQLGMGEGDSLFVMGFPHRLIGEVRNTVIVRQGCIARIQDLYFRHSSHYLIDAEIFEGNSGGPVINRPTREAIEGTPIVDHSYLIGIVSQTKSVLDPAKNVLKQDLDVLYKTHLGLGVIEPIENVVATIDHYRSIYNQ